ncbi:AEC family transporter [Yunchengibacter salinarum]|uniref:AEC family transporter n=1 Tax=Yunchengibacter salinarum TaxID=3133399 RepID=UPI0035B64CE7
MSDIVVIIAPVFLIILAGTLLGRTRLFPDNASHVCMNFVTYLAIPALLFRSLGARPLPGGAEMLLVAAYYLALYAVYALAVLVAGQLFNQTRPERAVFGLSVSFANGVFIGVPVMEGAFGQEGVRLLLIILSFHTLTLVPVTTFLLERGRALDGPGRTPVARVVVEAFLSIRQNPIILALVFSLLWSACGLPFPPWLDRLTALPAQAAAPVGLFAAGLALVGVRIAGDLPQALTAVGFKLVLVPAAVYAMTRFAFDLPPLWVGTATLLAALPTGMIAYGFAAQFDVGKRRAATTVLLSTLLSVVSLTVLLTLLV